MEWLSSQLQVQSCHWYTVFYSGLVLNTWDPLRWNTVSKPNWTLHSFAWKMKHISVIRSGFTCRVKGIKRNNIWPKLFYKLWKMSWVVCIFINPPKSCLKHTDHQQPPKLPVFITQALLLYFTTRLSSRGHNLLSAGPSLCNNTLHTITVSLLTELACGLRPLTFVDFNFLSPMYQENILPCQHLVTYGC